MGYIDASGNEMVNGGGAVPAMSFRHRSGVTAADADPAGLTTSGSLNAFIVPPAGSDYADCECKVTGSGSVTVCGAFYDPVANLFFQSTETTVISAPVNQLVRLETRGRTCYLKVVAVSGTPTLDAWVVSS